MFNFKKDIQVYIHANGVLQKLEVYSDLTYSQTYNEGQYKRKTLHNQAAVFNGAYVDSANTANFKFTLPVRRSQSILGTDYIGPTESSFDLYIVGTNTMERLTKSVIESVTYNISMSEVLTVSYSGSAQLLEPVSQLPATPVHPTGDYIQVSGIKVILDGLQLDSVAAINYEHANSIEWTENKTLHKSLAGQVSFKDSYVLSERRTSGSITQFITSENQALGTDYATAVPLQIQVYAGSSVYLDFYIPECTFTRRTNVGDLITRVIDFRRSNL